MAGKDQSIQKLFLLQKQNIFEEHCTSNDNNSDMNRLAIVRWAKFNLKFKKVPNKFSISLSMRSTENFV